MFITAATSSWPPTRNTSLRWWRRFSTPTPPHRRARPGKEASDDAGDERASRGIPRDGLLLRPRAVHRRAVVALHHRPAVRRRGGRAGRRPVLGTGRDLLAAGQAAARARH